MPQTEPPDDKADQEQSDNQRERLTLFRSQALGLSNRLAFLHGDYDKVLERLLQLESAPKPLQSRIDICESECYTDFFFLTHGILL